MSTSLKRIFTCFCVTLLSLACVLFLACMLFADNILHAVDGFVGNLLRGTDQVAVFEKYTATTNGGKCFEISSGFNSNLANFRLKMSDGVVLDPISMTEEEVVEYFVDKTTYPSEGRTYTSYDSGKSSLTFENARLVFLVLHSSSDMEIDLGNGEFLRLPVPKSELIKILGSPERWENVKRPFL